MKLKAYDLMKAAAENPQEYEGKQYKASGDVILKRTGDRADTDIITFKYGCPIVEGHATAFMSARTELEEIPPEPQPVPFMEAVKAYGEGKTVECKRGCCTHTYTPNVVNGESISAFSDENHFAPSAQEILHGEWTIK